MPWQRWASRRNRYINDLQCKRPWLGECVSVYVVAAAGARSDARSESPQLVQYPCAAPRPLQSACARKSPAIVWACAAASSAAFRASFSLHAPHKSIDRRVAAYGGFVRVRAQRPHRRREKEKEEEEEEEEEEKEEEEHEKGGRRKLRRGRATHFSSIKASCSLRNGRRNCE